MRIEAVFCATVHVSFRVYVCALWFFSEIVHSFDGASSQNNNVDDNIIVHTSFQAQFQSHHTRAYFVIVFHNSDSMFPIANIAII